MKRFNTKSLLAAALAACVAVVSLPLATLAGGGTAAVNTEPPAALTEGGETENISTVLAGAADNSIVDVDGDGKLDYVSLGASNVNGYGLQGYLPEGTTAADKADANVYGYGRCPEGSYPDLIRDYYEADGISVDMHQLGISSMRAEELRYLLDDSFTGDKYTEWRFTGGTSWFIQATGSIAATKAEYREAVATADLITLDIGVNNFGVYLSNEITSPGWLGHDVESLDTEYKAYYIYLREWILEKAPELAGYKDMLDTVAYAYLGFISSFDVSVAKIRELNPDATIVVVPVQCIIPDLKLSMDGIEFDLGYVVSELTNAANIYTAHLSPYHNEYLYASTIREDGKSRVEFYIDDIKNYNGDFSAYGEEEANILDCFMVYDDTVNVPVALPQVIAESMIKPGLIQYIETTYEAQLAAIGMSAEEFVKAGAEGAFKNIPDYQAVYDLYEATLKQNLEVILASPEYAAALDAAVDAYAQMCKIGANYYTINPNEFDSAAKTVVKAMGDILVAAATSGFEGNGNIVVPENLAEYIADNYGISAAAAETVLAFGVRSDIGNSFFGHPNRNGHREVADAVISAIENKTTGISFAADYAGGLMEKIVAIYKLADNAGLVEEAKKDASEAIKEFINEKKDNLLGNITNGSDNAADIIASSKDGIMNGVTSVIDKAKDVAEDILEKISGIVNKD